MTPRRPWLKRFSSCEPKAWKRFAWLGVTLLIANEIRGLIVVALFVKAML